MVRGFVAVLLCIGLVLGEEEASKDAMITHARVESCGGWRLNAYPEVKRFVYDDIPQFHNTEFKVISGAVPEIIFLDANGDEVERLSLEKRSRDECNQLLHDRGFRKKEEEPEEDEELGVKGEL